MTEDKERLGSSFPALDPAYELVSHLYESLRQVTACDAFREGLARQLDVSLHSVIYHLPTATAQLMAKLSPDNKPSAALSS
ncbi:hypothetical protein F6455_11935 [Proteobacteria bacterium 005FR1]|nr:hypothetical protein [Proteobacteria bacterium 005FR1]